MEIGQTIAHTSKTGMTIIREESGAPSRSTKKRASAWHVMDSNGKLIDFCLSKRGALMMLNWIEAGKHDASQFDAEDYDYMAGLSADDLERFLSWRGNHSSISGGF